VRVGIYSPYLDTLSGGEKYILSTASVLSKNCEVHIFWDDKAVINLGELKFNIDLSSVKQVKNIFSSDISTIQRLKESKKYDAILFLSDGSLPLVSSKLFVHFQFPVDWINSQSIIQSFKVKRVKKFFCNSIFTKEHIDKKLSIKSEVIYPPTQYVKDLPDINASDKKNIILNIGRYQRYPDGTSFKKQEFLIDSFKKMVDKDLKNWELHLVISYLDKDKQYVAEIKKMIGDYPIKILENVSNKDLLSEYKCSKIYWHASGFGEDLDMHPERAEHFGITTVEAMMYGVLPIVINAGGQSEIVEDGESGFLWNDQEELMLKTFLIISDSEQLNKMVKKSLEKSKNFTTDIFEEKILKLFS
jgi:glycosyltransferase involved in cell wall biosynthesis